MAPPRLLLILTENHTLVDPDDLVGLVRLASDAEAAGFDAVMASEHVVLGPSAGALGRAPNPRAYAAPGNQDPATCWPSSNLLLAAVCRRRSGAPPPGRSGACAPERLGGRHLVEEPVDQGEALAGVAVLVAKDAGEEGLAVQPVLGQVLVVGPR